MKMKEGQIITDFDKVLLFVTKVEIIDEKSNVILRFFSKGLRSFNQYVELNVQEEYEDNFRNLIYNQNRFKTIRTLKKYLRNTKNKKIRFVKNVELNFKPLI